MNIVFYILVMVAVILLWFMLAFLFKPIGNYIVRLCEDAKKEMELSKDNKTEKGNEYYEKKENEQS